MAKMDSNFNFSKEVAEKWNKKVKSVKIASIIISIVLVLCGIICLIYPIESVMVASVVASVVIMCLGVYQFVDYFCEPQYLRNGGKLVSGILNVIVGIMLVSSPTQVTIATFAFMFGFMLMMLGIDKIAFSDKLRYFDVSNHGWVIASGIFNILAAIAFMIAPFASTIVLNYFVAAYLFVGGIALFIEAVSMKSLKK